ncbi:hypothetical protein QWY85_09000 [Neolewinella lacunae]|uniref:Beta-ketoacyl synthase N-terminal domain-containing protein n=1 Tax=Neolewinella lacunae TaxID=1517758 RepID=A0A923TAL2_9BACT|nr:hypothetical protein [Neolewinella lacunae]MBC6996641.1 hypothetical protein [Neolewinella lacunae]MDN3634794.1 hypothetical protein [Neolewinella lacunae]
MKQVKLTTEAVFWNGAPLRRRNPSQALRDFHLGLLHEFYVGPEYRFSVVDDVGLACLAATAVCLHFQRRWHGILPEQRAAVFVTYSGSLVTDLVYQKSMGAGGRSSPRVFVQTLPNMVAGQVAACYAVRGEHFVLIQDGPRSSAIAETVEMCLKYGPAKVCLVAWVEQTETELAVELLLCYADAKDQAAGLLGSASMGRSYRMQ